MNDNEDEETLKRYFTKSFKNIQCDMLRHVSENLALASELLATSMEDQLNDIAKFTENSENVLDSPELKSGLVLGQPELYIKEPKCKGIYENCVYDEVDDSRLKKLMETYNAVMEQPEIKDKLSTKHAPKKKAKIDLNASGSAASDIRSFFSSPKQNYNNISKVPKTETVSSTATTSTIENTRNFFDNFTKDDDDDFIIREDTLQSNVSPKNSSLSSAPVAKSNSFSFTPKQPSTKNISFIPSNTTDIFKKSTPFNPKNISNATVEGNAFANTQTISKTHSPTVPTSTPVAPDNNPPFEFRTANEELCIQNMKKLNNSGYQNNAQPLFNYGKKSLGVRRNVQSKFIPPASETNNVIANAAKAEPAEEIDERLKHIDPEMIESIRNEIIVKDAHISWDDIAGLSYAKDIIQEAVIWPLLRPDIFTGLRRPPRGILLFGPPGTGKTLIGKCIASQSKSTFFNISAATLTSKWIGVGEKMVKALFAVAVVHQPAVVFIDEIDSLLTQRSDSEHESSRRMKTEFLVQLDGAATAEDERILIVGATNRPQELDEAVRRRLTKRLYIPLPEFEARVQILVNLMKSEKCYLTQSEIHEVAKRTDGYSGADMKVLCQEAAMISIRSILKSCTSEKMHLMAKEEVRDVNFDDFKAALNRVRASVSQNDLTQYIDWDNLYGSGAAF